MDGYKYGCTYVFVYVFLVDVLCITCSEICHMYSCANGISNNVSL